MGQKEKIISKELLKIWEYGRLILGEMVTTGPNTGIMSLPRGVRTCSIGNLIILFSGAPTCVWRHLTTPFPHRPKTLSVLTDWPQLRFSQSCPEVCR